MLFRWSATDGLRRHNSINGKENKKKEINLKFLFNTKINQTKEIGRGTKTQKRSILN